MRSCSECGLMYRSLLPHCGLDGAPIIETDRDLLIGRSIGPYRIEERLGEGGYAVLYRVEGGLALKLLLGEMASLAPLAERFRREALAMSRIDHPNVARVHEYGRTDRGLSYLVMELLRGHLLSDELASGPLERGRTIGIGIDLARGLAAAHSVGCIHRDVTPRNVMLVDSGAKLFDFGLVSLSEPRGDPRARERLTDVGTVVGTAEYVAPEIGFGHPATERSDLYSLGVVLYQMRMGRPPFTGGSRDIFEAHLLETVPPFPSVGPLERLILELLDRKPSHRPTDAAEVAQRLIALR